ncbi:MAG: VPLPA-CTERM sorting domain-containing protein [Gammaproteobacteria bacterium]|nr:VPLPA-CTERM sorting domain-containing protein [Gammaproteobacteria bacterium]
MQPFHLRQLALAVALTAVGLDASALVNAPTAYGALSNFDVYNNSSDDYIGFEIELEGIHKSAIPTYGANIPAVFTIPGRLQPSLEEVVTATGFSTILRYSGYAADGSVDYLVHPFVPGTPVATDGHSCVFGSGCEHFGMGYFGNPTGVRYQWLLQGAAPGSFVAGPLVQLGNPVWNAILPVGNVEPNPQVQPLEVEVEVDQPEQENEGAPVPPRWVKVFVDKAHQDGNVVHDAVDPNDVGREMQARLDALRSGSDDVVPQGKLGVDKDGNEIEIPEQEFEWELLTENEPPKVRGHVLDPNDVQVARRFEFYDFAGSVEQLALCSASGKKPDECDPDLHPELVGNLIGAQMGALNFDLIGQVGEAPAPVPLPPGLPALVSGLVALGMFARRRQSRG